MVKCGVYSYFCEDEVEDLCEHIEIALNILKEQSRLLRYANKVDSSLFKKVKMAIIFHDLGKVFFQNNFVRENCLSYRGHEYISTYIFHNFAKFLLRRGCLNDDLYDVAGAILLHHHAMELGKREPKLKKEDILEGFKKLEEISKSFVNFLEKDCEKEAFIETIIDISKKFSMSVQSNFLEELLRDVNIILEEIKKRNLEDKFFRRRLSILILTLIPIDYISAQKERKPTSTIFSEAVKDFFEIYIRN